MQEEMESIPEHPQGLRGSLAGPMLLVTQGMPQHAQVVLFHTLATMVIARIFPRGDGASWVWSKPEPKGEVDLDLFLTGSRN